MIDMTTIVEDVKTLPVGVAPQPIPFPHFPDALHAVVWRNWDVVERTLLAEVLHGTPEEITAIASSMGLLPQRAIARDELRRNYATVLRRNWHLLPYEQLCQILGWTAPEMQFYLNEDDFLWVKLGGYKPVCAPVYYSAPDAETQAAVRTIRDIVREDMDGALSAPAEPLFKFIDRFGMERVRKDHSLPQVEASDSFQFCIVYPYFLRYGDPLRGEGVDDVPEGYFAELAASGVNAIWIQAVLNTLAPWELAPHLSDGWEERITNLNKLIERCGKYGMKVMLYFNEPRAMPRAFFEKYPDLRGAEETPDRQEYSPDIVALCTSTQPVQDFIVNSVRHVFEKAPGLGGSFAITFSENLTNCYSREYDSSVADEYLLPSMGDGGERKPLEEYGCKRCAERGPEIVNAEVCTLIERGMREAGSDGHFLLYSWSTPEKWLPKMVELLPKSTYFISISEWGKEFTRGDYTGKINEYSISEVGPSELSLWKWDLAKKAGLRTAAKMQAANTYEFSSIPYIPALRLVAEHLSNVSQTGVEGVLLGWTAGGSPSPNLELVAEFTHSPRPTVEEAMLAVATRRFGAEAAPGVVEAWNALSDGYAEFPFDITVCYCGPQSLGPANLLWAEPTGFAATMSTFPFDDLASWRGPYSEETFIDQFRKTEVLWEKGVKILDELRAKYPSSELEDEWRIAEAARIHFRSTANQARFIVLRGSENKAELREILLDEIELSRQLMALVAGDSRIGFEASNHYGYIRHDLAEKILNCKDLLNRMA